MKQRGIGSVRAVVAGMLAGVWLTGGAQAQPVDEQNLPRNKPILFSIVEQARQSAEQSAPPAPLTLPESVANMQYEQYQAISFKPQQALWQGQRPFSVAFVHPGLSAHQPVPVVVVDRNNRQTELAFTPAMFDYGKEADAITGLDGITGFAGFSLFAQGHNKPFVKFDGATFMRLAGFEQEFGAAARALAIDTALPKGEETPRFTRFWLIEPGSDEAITVYARLESASVAGAYAFSFYPGKQVKVDVQGWLFARKSVKKLGLAPFTSMFLYGENTERQHDDYRPEVHDSDGVLMINEKAEQIWRPLTNPNRLQISALPASVPKGFGILQRDSDFDNYLDAQANYQLRPGLWVKPKEGFGEGHLETVEIPADSEIHDNISAHWVAAQSVKKGQSRYLRYTLHTMTHNPLVYNKAVVARTRQGASKTAGFESSARQIIRRFVVDFDLPSGFSLPAEELDLVMGADNAQIEDASIYNVNGNRQMRATFLLLPAGAKPVDIQLVLEHNKQAVSEVWHYVYQPVQ